MIEFVVGGVLRWSLEVAQDDVVVGVGRAHKDFAAGAPVVIAAERSIQLPVGVVASFVAAQECPACLALELTSVGDLLT